MGCWVAGVLALGALGHGPAVAQSSEPDFRLIAQSMGFLATPPTGTRELGIVYPDGSAAGKAEAEHLAASMADGLRSGALTLRPLVLSVHEVTAEPHVAALLLTNAALPQAASLAAAITGKGIPTICSDPGAVSAGRVVMAIRTQPRVEIYVSRAAASAAGVEFSTAFRLMIQER
jgi:hypothetical protein